MARSLARNTVVVPVPLDESRNSLVDLGRRAIAGQLFQQVGRGEGCSHVAFLHVEHAPFDWHAETTLNFVDKGEIALHGAVAIDVDRLARQCRADELEQGHVWTAPGAVDRKEAECSR